MKGLKNKELTALSLQELVVKLNDVRGELFKLQFQSVTSPASSYSSSRRALKKNVARLLTHLRLRVERELAERAQS